MPVSGVWTWPSGFGQRMYHLGERRGSLSAWSDRRRRDGAGLLQTLLQIKAALGRFAAGTLCQVVQQIGLSLLQNGNRQHGRTGAEIIHTIHKRLPPKFILTPKLKAARCALLC